MAIDPRDFGAVEARVGALEKEVRALNTKVDQLLALANQGKGAWWAGLTLATLISSAATFFATHLFNR